MISSRKHRCNRCLPIFASLVISLSLGLCLALNRPNESELYGPYSKVLVSFVDSQGRVDYAGLQSNRHTLDGFIRDLGNVPVASWNTTAQIAFWINAYNALTLRVIVDHYPIRSSFLTSLAYPQNSIRQIDGAWDEIRFRVAGLELTLDEIEHSILRNQFTEPRIHVALVCAAQGCPVLRREAYSGGILEKQLQDQAARFVGDLSKVRVDSDRGLVFLSSILHWFGQDFEKKYTPSAQVFPGRSSAQRAVLNFISPFLTEKDQNYLCSAAFRIRYLSYDWTLNQQ